jgi:phytoene synthase
VGDRHGGACGARRVSGLRPEAELAAAYEHCAEVTRRAGSSFAAAFWMLSPPRRRALHAIYAFCRLADDIADDPDVRGDRAALLHRWRAELRAAYRGEATHPVGIALADTVARFSLPEAVFLDLLRGVEWDLAGKEIDTFEDLQQYCYCVASTVGILVVRVLEARDPGVLDYAEKMGIAVQLTNVLRDVGHDAKSGRIYLAREDLERMNVPPEALGAGKMTEDLRLLLALYAERARIFYDQAARALPREERRRLRAAEAMGRIYRSLLEELQAKGFPCLAPEALRLSKPRRIAIAARTFLGLEARP